jgi:hypothetical protein
MKRCAWLLAAMLAVALGPGCQKRGQTPPDVTRAYSALVASLDPNAPGASLARLQAFARQNSRYEIATSVDPEIKAWRSRLEPAYLKGRDLVREDRFDEAEAILKDLAQLPDEKAGRLAREFLSFEFHQVKASRLLLKGDAAAAGAAARQALGNDLTEEQMAAAQRLLDSASTAGVGVTMMRTTALKSAARALQVFLHSSYAEEGQYPRALTLESPELASLRNSGAFGEWVGSIESYSATEDTFSLVLKGKDPRQRIRVTQSSVEEIP